MFKSIRLTNFKAYEDSGEVPLAPLTVVVGLNNTGKSTLLHAILALKQTVQDSSSAAFVTTGGLVELNGFYDILHGQEKSKEDAFSICLTLDSQQRVHYVQPGTDNKQSTRTLVVADRLDVSFCLREASDIQVKSAAIYRGDQLILKADGDGNWESNAIPGNSRSGVEVNFRGFLPILSLRSSSEEPVLSSEVLAAIHESTFHMHMWFRWLVHNIHRVNPLRRRVPWSHSVGTRTPSELGQGGENLLVALGSDEKLRQNGKTLLESVNDWISTKGILSRIHLESGKLATVRMLLGDEINGLSDINVAGMGEGISQVLPIISRSMATSPGDCLLVEQPEIHLHPALQGDLADLFIEIAAGDRRQVIVETHSEHLVLRIRRRIAEGTLDPSQVSILYVEKNGTSSTIRRLDLNSRGHFGDWPEGFFDEAYQEAMALAEASSRNHQ